MGPELIQRIAIFMPAMFLSLTVHEYAHAWTATTLGDDTALREGRLSLSPLAHLDPMGSVAMPLLGLFFVGGAFGWARPVPFNPVRLSRRVSMRTGSALVAAAGPASNLLLAVVALLAYRLFFWSVGDGGTDPSPVVETTSRFVWAMFVVNTLLAVFNLLPVPPLDGSYLLPRSLDRFKASISNYSFFVILLVFIVPVPGLGSSLGGFAVHLLQGTLLRLLA